MNGADRPPLRLGSYEPLLELASGGMASVYVARRIGAAGFEHIVVLKRVHRHLLNNREFYDMFRDEARVASLVRHPNVVPVVDVVESEGELFLVMDYIESCALATIRKAANDANKKIPIAIASRILCDALAGLHAAHEVVDVRGNKLDVVHRDMSPQNIIVGVDGSSRIIDFGVAKARNRLTETKSGSLKGKYSYMAPEQAKGLPIDRRTDLFAVGVVLWETLTGDRLFRGENDLDTMRRIIEAPIPNPSSVNADVPQSVDAIVKKALAREPDERYATASEFLEALEKALPPAPSRQVSAWLEDVCGDRLADRRALLREMLEGRLAPLAPNATEGLDPHSVSSGGESVPQLRRSEGTAGKIAVYDATLATPSPRRKTWVALAASVAVIGAVALAVIAGRSSSSSVSTASATVAAATGAPVASVSTTAAATPPAVDEIELTLTADAPIRTVEAQGVRSLEIRGTHARLVVAKWIGALSVDAALDGGKRAHASVDAQGSRDVRLAPVASTKPGPKPPPTAHPTATELQSNPYGNP